MVEGTKLCTACRRRSSLSNFHKNPGSLDGRHTWCKPCASAKNKETTARNKRRLLEGGDSRPAEKKCRNCGETKARADFYNTWGNLDGISGTCRYCTGIKMRERDFGLSEAEQNALYEKQEGMCANQACRKVLHRGRERQGGHIDHNHTSGRTRGLLCRECNIALGLAGDSGDVLRGLAEYRERFGEEENSSDVIVPDILPDVVASLK
jgi:hypothetical protein